MSQNQDKEKSVQMLNEGDTSKIAGGFLGPNKYSASEYRAAGIEVCPHVLKKDEFFIIKTNRKITKEDANNIVALKKLNDDTLAMERKIKSHVRKSINEGNFTTDLSAYDGDT